MLVLVECVGCGTSLPEDALLHGRGCRPCSNARLAVYRGRKDVARRLLHNLRQRCRAWRIAEGTLWSLGDVEELVARWMEARGDDAPSLPRLRIKRIDGNGPWVPANAVVVEFGRR